MKAFLKRLFNRRDWRLSLLLSRTLVAVVAGLIIWWVVSALDDDSQPTEPVSTPVAVSQEQDTTNNTPTQEPTPPPETPTQEPTPPAGEADENDSDCEPFAVYSQGRWTPYGATIREGPSIAATRVTAITPNVAIPVNGWTITDAAYPENPEPWNSPVWFRLTDGSGWVSFPGVRSRTSEPGGTDGPAGGGWPVDLTPECEIQAAP